MTTLCEEDAFKRNSYLSRPFRQMQPHTDEVTGESFCADAELLCLVTVSIRQSGQDQGAAAAAKFNEHSVGVAQMNCKSTRI